MLPYIHHLQEIGIQPRFHQESAEGDLMELGRAGRDDHPIETEVLDVFQNLGLAGLGAGVQMVAADRHLRELLSLAHKGFRTDDPGDIEAAVTDI